MTVTEVLERLAGASSSAEVFVLVQRDEQVTAPVADLVEVDHVEAVVFRLIEP